MQTVLASQIVIAISLLSCVLLEPQVVTKLPQGGLSNFGTFTSTTYVFSFGFFIATGLLAHYARGLANLQLRRIILTYATGLIVLALSTYPYKINAFFENLHIAIGFLLAIFQLVVLVILAKQLSGSATTKILIYGLVTLSLVAGLLTTLNLIGLLFTSQLLLGTAFAITLVRVSALSATTQ